MVPTAERSQETARPAGQAEQSSAPRTRRCSPARLWLTCAAAIALVLVLLASAAVGTAFLWYRYGLQDRAATPGFKPQPVSAGEPVNILVLGMDREGVRSDTMMVLSFDPDTRGVGLLSIPRDTRARIYTAGPEDLKGLAGTDLRPDHMDKVNAATAYRSRVLAGVPRSMKSVEALLGVPIPYYVQVKLDGLVAMVDRLGGIDFDVSQNMNYDDPTQDLHIHLRKGRQHLNGHQVMELVRYRGYFGGTPDKSDDLARIRVQQEVLRVVLARMESTGALAELPGLASDLARAIDTNLPVSKLMSLAIAARDLDPEQVQMAVLPGYPVGPAEGYNRDYYVPDMKAAKPLIERLLRRPGPQSRDQAKV